MRHELKHMINQGDYLLLSSRLSKLFPRDPHTGAHGEYRVRSLYFDTPGDHALRDKIDGVNKREKFRLRMYNDNSSFIRLEKKIKQGGMCAKRSAAVSIQQAEALLAGEIQWLFDSGDPLLQELYSKIRGQRLSPKTIVEYMREPFTFPAGNVRITLDRDIRTGLCATRFFDTEVPLMGTFEAYAVLEIKYDQFMPDIVAHAVQIPNRRHAAFSKYAICRKYG